MNIMLNDNHVKTLYELKDIVDKYNCYIRFGLNNNSEFDYINWDLIKEQTNASDEIIEELQEKLSIDSSNYECFTYWFELYDARNKTYHLLSYIKENTYFNYTKYDFDFYQEEPEKWIENNFEYDTFYSCSSVKQEIKGFKQIDTSFVNVYREGMLLKFFGDLVCDYLGVERIKRVY